MILCKKKTIANSWKGIKINMNLLGEMAYTARWGIWQFLLQWHSTPPNQSWLIWIRGLPRFRESTVNSFSLICKHVHQSTKLRALNNYYSTEVIKTDCLFTKAKSWISYPLPHLHHPPLLQRSKRVHHGWDWGHPVGTFLHQ